MASRGSPDGAPTPAKLRLNSRVTLDRPSSAEECHAHDREVPVPQPRLHLHVVHGHVPQRGGRLERGANRSMQPTIHIGDRILVDKLAYDVRLPLTHISLRHPADPQRGDIVVLDSHVADERLVQRLIGLQATKWQRAVHRRPASQLCGEPPQQHHFPRGDRLGIALD